MSLLPCCQTWLMTQMHILSSTATFVLVSPFALFITSIAAHAYYNGSEIGTIDWQYPFTIEAGENVTPKLPVEWGKCPRDDSRCFGWHFEGGRKCRCRCEDRQLARTNMVRGKRSWCKDTIMNDDKPI